MVVYYDTMFLKRKPLNISTLAKFFAPDYSIHIHPIVTKYCAGDSLDLFSNDVGIPKNLVIGGERKQVGGKT